MHGLSLMAGAGDPGMKEGLAVYMYVSVVWCGVGVWVDGWVGKCTSLYISMRVG